MLKLDDSDSAASDSPSSVVVPSSCNILKDTIDDVPNIPTKNKMKKSLAKRTKDLIIFVLESRLTRKTLSKGWTTMNAVPKI